MWDTPIAGLRGWATVSGGFARHPQSLSNVVTSGKPLGVSWAWACCAHRVNWWVKARLLLGPPTPAWPDPARGSVLGAALLRPIHAGLPGPGHGIHTFFQSG